MASLPSAPLRPAATQGLRPAGCVLSRTRLSRAVVRANVGAPQVRRVQASNLTEVKKQSNQGTLVKFLGVGFPLTIFQVGAAHAVEAKDVTEALEKAEDFINSVIGTATQVYEATRDVVEQIVEVSKPVVDAAVPAVVQATKAAIEFATPVAVELAGQATKALNEAGVDTSPVVEVAQTAASVAGDLTEKTGKVIEAVTPYATTTVETVQTLDPTSYAIAAAALLALYISAPSIAGALTFSARGYAGDFTAPQTLDLLTKEDYTLVDVRTEQQKGKSGIPLLPKNAKKKLVLVPLEEVPAKLKGQVRDSKRVEADLTAIKIAALKRLNKGSKTVIIDATGEISRQVAQALTSRGFSSVWVVKDGVDGGSGWVQSQLATDRYNAVKAEVITGGAYLALPRSSSA